MLACFIKLLLICKNSNRELKRLEFCQRDHFFYPVICNSIVTPRICYIIDIVHLNKYKVKYEYEMTDIVGDDIVPF